MLTLSELSSKYEFSTTFNDSKLFGIKIAIIQQNIPTMGEKLLIIK
jgi:hypothetical protein